MVTILRMSIWDDILELKNDFDMNFSTEKTRRNILYSGWCSLVPN